MKKVIFNLGFYLLLLSLVTISGCLDDEEITKEDFIGTYNVADVCNGDDASYLLSISDVIDSDNEIIITNLWDWEEDLTATISGNTITIFSQVADETTFSGSGKLSGNTLVINYTAVDDLDSERCVATATKQ